MGFLIFMATLFLFPLENLQAQQGEMAYKMTSTMLQEKFYKTQIDQKISVDFRQATVEEALRQIANRTGLKLTYRGDIIEEKQVNLSKQEVTVTDALNFVLQGTELDYLFSQDGYLLVYATRDDLIEIQFQQEIRGTVTDAETGEPLPGVNVIVAGSEESTGSTIGTTTDMDGNYEIQVPEELNVLVFSYIGYQRTEVQIDGRTEIDLSLQLEVVSGEELVVVGYGTQEKQQITGSVSRIEEENFVQGDVNNAANLIQGKVPGLTVSTPGGNPNQDPTIRLRGISSFGANQEPLVVVDGIIGASLRNVDPNDVESIDVLKDASAASIYGTRAAAGVIVITTKKGESGRTNASYNGSFSVLGVESKTDVLTADEFRELSQITGFSITDYGANTDWFDEITRTGTNQVHNLSVSGGNETTNYRVSGNFRDNLGIQRKTGFQSQNLRLKVTHNTLDDKLRLTAISSVTNRQENRGFDEAFAFASNYNPTAPVSDPNGQIRSDGFTNTGGFVEMQVFEALNPVAIIETGENNAEVRRLNISVKGDLLLDEFVPGLSGSVFYSLETEDTFINRFFSKNNKFAGRATQSALGQGRAERNAFDNRSELFEITTNYTADLERLNIEILGGYSWQDFENGGTMVGGGDFISDAVKSNNLQFAQDFANGLGNVNSFKETNTLIAGFGRSSLNFDDTYFLNGSVRREASTRFGENEKWGTFWSVGGGVELTNLFVEINKINSLRLRASYGVSGQDAPANGLSKLIFAPRGNFFIDGEFSQSFGPASNPNPDLKWEENKEFNVGMDVAAIDNRLNFTFEYFSKKTDDLLFQLQVPVPPNLFPTTWENIGELNTNGFEISLGYDIFRSQNVRWNSLFNFSTFDTKLAEFVSDDARTIANLGVTQNNTDLIRIKEGEKLGQIWGPRFAGVDENGNELFFSADGKKITFGDISSEDNTVIGDGLPAFQIGWTNTINYKKWDLTTFMRGAFGHDLVNTKRAFFELPSNITQWNVLHSAFDFTNIKSSPKFSNRHVENASFLRFQNFTIGYTPSIGDFLNIRRLRLYFSGNNLFTITGYDGIDPEVRFEDTAGAGPLAPGIERRDQWFTTRSWTVGINLDF
jgi:iron complex outermembrane receptor protein